MNNIQTFLHRRGYALLTGSAACLMVAGIMYAVSPTNAADTVCGDGVLESPEVCDDGNLNNGDGCSSVCTSEACGNDVMNAGEQCDDGNKVGGDGCNNVCRIEFCGDSAVQASRGEQCDDGNGISGDGCSSSCKSEAPHSAASSSEESKPTLPSTPPPQTAPPIIVSQAKQGIVFLTSPGGEDYKEHLTRTEGLELEMILNKLNNGRRLTAEEREWAENLFRKLEEAKFVERVRYTDLLKEFISTPISADVVEEKELKVNRLVDVEVPIAISELENAIDIIRRGELQSQVSSNLARLKRQGIDVEVFIPPHYEKSLEAATRPIEVFAMLKSLKETAESFATQSVPDSLEIIRSAVEAMRDAIPVFEQEYGIAPDEIESLLVSIETTSLSATKLDTEKVVAAVNRLLSYLEREKVFSSADIASLELRTAHTAAAVKRLMDDVGARDMPDDIPTFVEQLSSAAPEEAKPAFERGGEIAQRVVLLQFLEKDERMTSLRAILRKDGRKDFDDRFSKLKASIARVGTDDDRSTMCDDSMQDALRCSSDFLSDLQEAVRSRSIFARFIGKLQDYFNIGS